MHGAAQWGMCNLLFAGAGVVLYTQRGLDPHEIWDIVERERCMTLTIVGDAMGRPLADALADGTRSYDLSGFYRVGLRRRRVLARGPGRDQGQVPHVQVMDSYGASEMGAGGTSAEGGARRFVVSPELNVLDEDLRPVKPGEIGRLARTGHIPLGYYKDEAKTAATFPVDPDGRRWSVPGDFATIDDDGVVTLLGRGSQCINTGGEKVYPEEVEEALKSHPDVYDALVVGVPDERWGERVVAVVQARGDARPSVEEISQHCRHTLAGYKVPRALTYVTAIQRSPAGKADYRWAKEQAVGRVDRGRGPRTVAAWFARVRTPPATMAWWRATRCAPRRRHRCDDCDEGTMTVDLGLSADQEAIAELFDGFFAKECPPPVARAAEPLGFDRDLWDKLVELGAPGMGSPEASGGGGATISDLVVVAEALGRAIAPVPLVDHWAALSVLDDADLVAGEAIAAVSIRPADADGNWWLVPAGAVADVVVGVDGDELVAVRSDAPMAGPRNHASLPDGRSVGPPG